MEKNTPCCSAGTSGCTNDGTIFASEKVNVFAAVNFDNLAQEMAQGQGEHLTSLATLMGIPAEQHGVFFSMAQEKYTTLIQTGIPFRVASMGSVPWAAIHWGTSFTVNDERHRSLPNLRHQLGNVRMSSESRSRCSKHEKYYSEG